MIFTELPLKTVEWLVDPDMVKHEWECNELARTVERLAYEWLIRERTQPANDPIYNQ